MYAFLKINCRHHWGEKELMSCTVAVSQLKVEQNIRALQHKDVYGNPIRKSANHMQFLKQ